MNTLNPIHSFESNAHLIHVRHLERHVIGACLMERTAPAVARRYVTAQDFTEPAWRVAFDAICKLHDQGRHVDPTSVYAQATFGGRDIPLTPEMLYDVAGSTDPFNTSLDELAKQVAETASVRDLHSRVMRVLLTAHMEDYAEIPSRIASLCSTARREQKPMVHIADVIAEIETTEDTISVTPTGYPSLDDKLGGGLCGGVTILGGRPGMGKSALAAAIGLNVAQTAPGTVLYFCMEMRNRRTVQRMIAQKSDVPFSRIQHNAMGPRERERVSETLAELRRTPMKLCDAGTLTTQRIYDEVVAEQASSPVSLVVVDYLQQLSPMDKKHSKYQAVSASSNAILRMSLDLNVPVLLLAQLGRDTEKDKTPPRKTDLRDSGEIEQDAECIMFVWQPFIVGASTDPTEAMLIIDKQRNGTPVATVPLRWDGTKTRYVDPMWSSNGW
jgi:replicative DNA helicase